MSEFRARKTEDTDSFFRAFMMDAGVEADGYDAVAFGYSPEMADELVELALLGIKRATASLAEDYGPGKERLPAVGDYVVVCDGRNKPRFVWRTAEIVVKPLNAVDDSFAFDEGEGERTRGWWLDAHRREFGAEAARKRRGKATPCATTFRSSSNVSRLSGRAFSPMAGKARGRFEVSGKTKGRPGVRRGGPSIVSTRMTRA